MHALLERVSLVFQRDDLSIGDVGAEVNSAIDQIAKLGTTCGKLESQVHNFGSSGQVEGYWASNSFAISRADEDSALDAHNKVSVQASSGRLILALFRSSLRLCRASSLCA